MRFLSERYQQGLSERIKGLQAKRGELTDLQKMSSVARFDKASGKIARRSRIKGTIAQLKAYREQVFQEIALMRNDMARFSSTASVTIPKMKRGKVISIDEIRAIQAQRALENEGKAMGAAA